MVVYENEDFLNKFDRVISVEMFEHMKNYGALLRKISGLEFSHQKPFLICLNLPRWMAAGGKLFVHIFTHKWKPYHFKDDWMARTFFTGERGGEGSLVLL